MIIFKKNHGFVGAPSHPTSIKAPPRYTTLHRGTNGGPAPARCAVFGFLVRHCHREDQEKDLAASARFRFHDPGCRQRGSSFSMFFSMFLSLCKCVQKWDFANKKWDYDLV